MTACGMVLSVTNHIVQSITGINLIFFTKQPQ